jgi:uncharacterized cupin superfamily protein
VTTEFFEVSEVVAVDRVRESCNVVVGVRGRGTISGDSFEPVTLGTGATVVVPRAIDGAWKVEPVDGGVRFLAVQLAGV